MKYPICVVGSDLENSLQPLEQSNPSFLICSGFYAVEYSPDSSGEIVLWQSGSPDGADCRCTYHYDHLSHINDSDVASLPERHLELVMLYVRWASFQELASSESADPDPISLAISTLEPNAYRAQRLYLASLAEVKKAESESRQANWKMDGWDRVY